jgi:acyl-CoA thioesterase-2
VYGGHLAAQALTAAGRTVDRPAHSLHCTFHQRGDSRQPVDYTVERLTEGRTYASRMVHARQEARLVLSMTASFKAPEAGHDRQSTAPSAPPPEELPDPYPLWASRNPQVHDAAEWRRVAELRFVPGPRQGGRGAIDQLVWIRVPHVLDADPLLHAAALTYCSDLTLAHTAALDIEPHVVHRTGPRRTQLVSLNHSMWFHRAFRADDWLLFAQRSPSATDGRGLARGEFWSRDGRLVASAVQESVLRFARAHRRVGERGQA